MSGEQQPEEQPSAKDMLYIKVQSVLSDIMTELDRAMSKNPEWPNDPLHALAVLQEEVGELSREMLMMTYEPHRTNGHMIKVEAIQTAAMSIRLILSLPSYRYEKSTQHRQ